MNVWIERMLTLNNSCSREKLFQQVSRQFTWLWGGMGSSSQWESKMTLPWSLSSSPSSIGLMQETTETSPMQNDDDNTKSISSASLSRGNGRYRFSTSHLYRRM